MIRKRSAKRGREGQRRPVRDVVHERYEPTTGRPTILSDLFNDIYPTATKNAVDPVTKEQLASIDAETVNFQTSFSACLHHGPDRLCLYDGELRLQALELYLSNHYIPGKRPV